MNKNDNKRATINRAKKIQDYKYLNHTIKPITCQHFTTQKNSSKILRAVSTNYIWFSENLRSARNDFYMLLQTHFTNFNSSIQGLKKFKIDKCLTSVNYLYLFLVFSI